MTQQSFGMRRWWACVVVAACLAVAIWAPGADRYQRSAVSFHDFLHVPMSAIVTGALFWALPAARPLNRMGRMALVGVLAFSLGGLVELAQQAGGGAVDVRDVVRNVGGIAMTMLLVPALNRRRRPWVRWSAGAVAAGILAAFLFPTLVDLVDEDRARRQFPVLAGFHTPRELDRFRWPPETRAAIIPAEEMGGPVHALRLELTPGPFPGVSLMYFPRDWRGWDELVLECTNPQDAPLRLTVRIDDLEHNHQFGDRFNRSYDVDPGRQEIRVPLADVEAAPAGRILDLGRVRSVVLFVHRLQAERALLVNRLRLDR